MKRLFLVPILLSLVACGSHVNTPAPPADPMTVIRQDAKTAIDALNAASVISVTALNVAKASPLPAATVTKISDAVRAYNCALLDEGNAAPMPGGGTVTDSCHAHANPMLGIISKIEAAGSAATLHALALQGLALASQAFQAMASSGNADLAKYAQVALTTLAVIQVWA